MPSPLPTHWERNFSISPATSNIINLLENPAHRFGIRHLRRQPLRFGGVDQSERGGEHHVHTAVGTPSTRQITVTSEGANQSVNTSCTDTAGNSVNASFSGSISTTRPLW